MELSVSRKRIGKNIKALVHWYGGKKSEIEKEASVSQGYLSRLAKDSGNDSSPIINLLLLASEKYRVPIDSLVSRDFEKITDASKMRLHSFLETLLYLSNRGELCWKRYDGEEIKDEDAVAGFYVDYNSDISFYIFKLDFDDYYEVPGFSFFIRNKGTISKVVKINLPGPAMYETLDQLYESAVASTESSEIDDSAESAIRCFMSANALVIDPSEDQRKYRPLFNYLSQQDSDVVTLSFTEMEDILDFALPTSAQRYPSFWANNENGQHHHCRSWLDAGYKTVNVHKNIIDMHMRFEKVNKD